MEQLDPNVDHDTQRAERKRSAQPLTTPNVKRRRVAQKKENMLSPLSFIATLSPIATPDSQRQNDRLSFQLPLKM